MRALLVKFWKNEVVQWVLLRVGVLALFVGMLASIFMSGSMPEDDQKENPAYLRQQYREYEAEKQEHGYVDPPVMQRISDEVYGR